MKKYQLFKCELCGNEVEVQAVGGGTLSCCNQPMDLIEEKVTPTNLLKAFAGESMARNKYDFFAQVAAEEGFEQIAAFFRETSRNEHSHAHMEYDLYRQIVDGDQATLTTISCLEQAAQGENYEHTTMYPEFADIAKEEGFDAAARLFRLIAKVEEEHEKRYQKLAQLVKDDAYFEGDDDTVWVCKVCGHIHRGKKAPGKCPVCKVPKAMFERACLDY